MGGRYAGQEQLISGLPRHGGGGGGGEKRTILWLLSISVSAIFIVKNWCPEDACWVPSGCEACSQRKIAMLIAIQRKVGQVQ